MKAEFLLPILSGLTFYFVSALSFKILWVTRNEQKADLTVLAIFTSFLVSCLVANIFYLLR